MCTDGFTALRELTRSVPSTAVCVLTMSDDDDSLFAAMRAGAQGYLLKGAEQEEIERAVRGVASGEAVFGPGVARRVLTHLTAPPRPNSLSLSSPLVSAMCSTCSGPSSVYARSGRDSASRARP